MYGFDYGKRQEFLYYIERMDDKFMDIAKKAREEEERKKKVQEGSGKSGSNGRPGSRR